VQTGQGCSHTSEAVAEYASYEIFMAVKIQVEVSWAVMLCSAAVGYQCFGGHCCLCFHPEDGGSKVL
jgi:hypothetical protein